MAPAFILSGDIKELNPVLKSGWLGVHTSFAVLGDAAFAFAFIVSIMYLIQERQLKAKHLGAIFHRLPSLDIMDTLGYKALTFGWPLFTLGMITGSIWANSAWGTYWSWDPKETWSLITWVDLSGAPASSHDRMAGQENGLSFDRRVCVCSGQFLRRQPREYRKAYVLRWHTNENYRSRSQS